MILKKEIFKNISLYFNVLAVCGDCRVLSALLKFKSAP